MLADRSCSPPVMSQLRGPNPFDSYQRLTRLLDELALARVDGKATRLLAQLARIQLLIIDDWAMARLTAEQRRDLMEVIDDRHQRASTILATQIPIERWHDTGLYQPSM
jgi:DNA replication protein DnaC